MTTDRRALILLAGEQNGYAPGLADLAVVPEQQTVKAFEPETGVSVTIELRVDV